MSGHSKWATIKRDKESNDSKKGAVFTKLSKDISSAAKLGGGDPASNATLSIIISKAKAVNMPNDKIQKAIDRGLGVNKSGLIIQDVSYEAYTPGEVGIIIDASTDNRNRTIAEVKTIVEKAGGRLVEGGAVSWLFETKGYIFLKFESDEEKKKRESLKWGEKIDRVKLNKEGLDDFQLDIMDQQGLLDIIEEYGGVSIYTLPENLNAIKIYIEEKNIEVEESEIIKKAKTEVNVDSETQERISALVSRLEEHDDVSDVWVALS